MLIGKDGVEGVRLEDGSVIRSNIVLSNATPEVTFIDLLPSGVLPESYLSKVKSVDYTSPVTKINGAHLSFSHFFQCYQIYLFIDCYYCYGIIGIKMRSCLEQTAKFPRRSTHGKRTGRSSSSLYNTFELWRKSHDRNCVPTRKSWSHPW